MRWAVLAGRLHGRSVVERDREVPVPAEMEPRLRVDVPRQFLRLAFGGVELQEDGDVLSPRTGTDLRQGPAHHEAGVDRRDGDVPRQTAIRPGFVHGQRSVNCAGTPTGHRSVRRRSLQESERTSPATGLAGAPTTNRSIGRAVESPQSRSNAGRRIRCRTPAPRQVAGGIRPSPAGRSGHSGPAASPSPAWVLLVGPVQWTRILPTVRIRSCACFRASSASGCNSG